MFSPDQPWVPQINWNAPAGKVLRHFISCLPKTSRFSFTVFGSAPLQLGLEDSFLSGDVDIFAPHEFSSVIQMAGLAKGMAEIYIEQCDESVFIASTSWKERSYTIELDNVLITFPHPVDILVAKIRRLAPKDLRAYHLVYSKTGHPTEDELKLALQRVVDIYRPAFDEDDTGGDPLGNTLIVWKELYHKEIDVRAEIIKPALAKRRESYGLNAPQLKIELRQIGSVKEQENKKA